MKKFIVLAVLMFAGSIYSQNAKPVLEPYGKKVKATYFYENGQIQQVGFFENGKLEGNWVSYNENGDKIAMGEYTKGVKTGKWLFWTNEQLAEVDYSKNNITAVKSWTQTAMVNN
ncbi:MAG TPA: hypothetical protein VN192_03085 [Flavobacterium sp.]|nr:hypothetical protein [Flavobacterium sp.]